MSPALPAKCTNPECGQPTVRQIHCSAQGVPVAMADGSMAFAHNITYRCAECGHTWATRGFVTDDGPGRQGEPQFAPLQRRPEAPRA